MRPEAVAVEMIHAGYIRIDETGQVWRLKKRQQSGVDYVLPAARMIGSKSRLGYMSIRVRVNGKGVNVGTHRVVWWFHNGPISSGMEINHKNGIKDDNSIGNLELMTHQDNIRHSWATGLATKPDPMKIRHSTMTWDKVRELRRLFESGEANQPTLATIYGISQANVSQIIRGKRWPESVG